VQLIILLAIKLTATDTASPYGYSGLGVVGVGVVEVSTVASESPVCARVALMRKVPWTLRETKKEGIQIALF
jgi:hypothetical protein